LLITYIKSFIEVIVSRKRIDIRWSSLILNRLTRLFIILDYIELSFIVSREVKYVLRTLLISLDVTFLIYKMYLITLLMITCIDKFYFMKLIVLSLTAVYYILEMWYKCHTSYKAYWIGSYESNICICKYRICNTSQIIN